MNVLSSGEGSVSAEVWAAKTVHVCLIGMLLKDSDIEITPDIVLKSTFAASISTTMLAFAPAGAPNLPHPTPWAAVHGGRSREAHVELMISSKKERLAGAAKQQIVWLLAATLRLSFNYPILCPYASSTSFSLISENWAKARIVKFEDTDSHFGAFCNEPPKISLNDGIRIAVSFRTLRQLYVNDTFARAFTTFDQARWCSTAGNFVISIWTALEILFGVSASGNKTQLLSKRVSKFLCDSSAQEQVAAERIKYLLEHRGGIVHAARHATTEIVIETYLVAQKVFERCLDDVKLP
jgi:predicted nucleic acid-binding protein